MAPLRSIRPRPPRWRTIRSTSWPSSSSCMKLRCICGADPNHRTPRGARWNVESSSQESHRTFISRHAWMPRARRMPMTTARSIRGARIRVRANVIHALSAWGFDRRHRPTSAGSRIRPRTAAITMPLSTARGRGARIPATGRNRRTATPVIAPLHRERAPARWFRLERPKEPPTGKPLDRAAATLATPWLMNSRSGSHGRRSMTANVREMEAASANPTSAITPPGINSSGSCGQGTSRGRGGRPAGTSPTIAPE